MDQRPIGVFDSGLGGLTALRELRKILPGEDLVYFGDTGRVPYGTKSREIILRYARQDVAFLRTFDPKAIVVACGTVSANALTELTAENDLPIFGVVGAAAQAAVEQTQNGQVGLIGTSASIRSGAYGPVPFLCPWWRTAASAPETGWWSWWPGSTYSPFRMRG